MHWFWRAAIAAVVSLTYARLAVFLETTDSLTLVNRITEVLFGRPLYRLRDGGSALIIVVIYIPPTVVLAFVTYAALTKWLRPSVTGEGETRCRKCSYILRGIREPRPHQTRRWLFVAFMVAVIVNIAAVSTGRYAVWVGLLALLSLALPLSTGLTGDTQAAGERQRA